MKRRELSFTELILYVQDKVGILYVFSYLLLKMWGVSLLAPYYEGEK